MENLILTQVHYEPLNQNDFKKVITYDVEKTATSLLHRVKEIDYQIFVLKQVRIKLNKDGSVPKNLNKAFYIEGATLKEKESKEHSFNSFFATTENGQHYNFTTRAEKWCDNEYLKITISPCDEEGYTHCECYQISLLLGDNFNGVDDLKAKCDENISKLKDYQITHIAQINSLNDLAKDFEKIDLRGVSLSALKNWF